MSTPTPGPRLTVKQHRVSGGVLVRLGGTIDESLDHAALLNGLDGVVVFDLEHVTQATSFGVREWVNVLSQIRGQLFFVKCRPSIVSQFNMVRGFGGSGKLVSVFLPYVCTSCGSPFDKLLDLRTDHEVVETSSPPSATCPRCSSPAEFDDIPESYFSYIAKQPRPQPPPLFESLLASDLAAPEPTSLKVEKEINGGLTGLWLSGTLDGKDYFRRAADGIEGALMLSMEGVSSWVPEGLDRLCAFIGRLKVPTTLADVPVELATRVANLPDLATRDLGVRTVVAEFSCLEHGKSLVSLSLSAVKYAPPLVLCSRCRKPLVSSFSEADLELVRKLPLAKTNPEEAALIQAHSMSHVDATSLKTPTWGQLVPGAVVMGRYRFEKLLGAGGMAEVFLAKQSSIGGFEKLVVIKRILPGLATEASFVEMFLAEARVAARISHPNVVQIQDVGKESGQYFIVMEYVNGWDMAQILRKAITVGMLPPVSVAMHFMADLARGLHAAHTSVDASGQKTPVIHRDVSPHNVLLGRDGIAKVTDFGIAKAADCLTVTPTSIVKGKTAYLAPEVVNASMRSLPSPSIDIFALGVVMYQSLTGVNPFRKESDVNTLSAILHEDPAPVVTLRPDVPAALSALLTRVLEKNPADRVQTAGEVAESLQIILSGYGPQERTPAAWLAELEGVAPLPPVRDGVTNTVVPKT